MKTILTGELLDRINENVFDCSNILCGKCIFEVGTGVNSCCRGTMHAYRWKEINEDKFKFCQE